MLHNESQNRGLSQRDLKRLTHWESCKNYVSVGNLGEHITGRLLIDLDYQVLAGQDDLLGMVPDVLGTATMAKPEDFIAIDPLGRLVTVNSKASIAPRACRILRTGNLSTPRLARGQGSISYSTLRANLITPLEGDSYCQVVKVDLVHLKAQIFEIQDSGKLAPMDHAHDITRYAQQVLKEFPDRLPAPRAWDLS